ncbi:hypothetical protein DPMN_007900 [Dreissena polymorpha]|uniref:Uncharacterized protein n=1 Tax=Dreissena polymorpha TaxID=45954 RepID=A0A9D4MXC5_DREPO|nr:hypothetical protein DPMN_007900 [Dreissena polymorpha]
MSTDTESDISHMTKDSKANVNQISKVDEQVNIFKDLVKRIDRLEKDISGRRYHYRESSKSYDERTHRSDKWRGQWRRSGNQGHDNNCGYQEDNGIETSEETKAIGITTQTMVTEA